MRRKHHRAWTLVEVIKLVEGVSRCGAGRWSEIKRLSFASYSYRTSVDLKVIISCLMCTSDHVKGGRVCARLYLFLSLSMPTLNTHFTLQDKWRNLLKASFAMTPAPADEGVRIYDNLHMHGLCLCMHRTVLACMLDIYDCIMPLMFV